MNSETVNKTKASEKKLLMASLVGLCLSNFILYSAPLYIGTLIDGLKISEADAGLILTSEIGSVAVITLLISSWLNKISLRLTSTLGVTLVLIANVATLVSSEYEMIIILRIIAGLGAGLSLAASSAIISKTRDPDKTFASLLVMITLIMIIALFVMGYITEDYGFNGVIGFFTLVVFLVSPLIIFIPEKQLLEQQTAEKVTSDDHHFWLGALAIFLVFITCIIEGSVWSFSERVGTNLKIDDANIGKVLAMAQLMGLTGASLSAFIGDRVTRIVPIFIGITIMGFAGFELYQTSSQLVYSICLGSFNFGFFVALPYMLGACARLDTDGRWASRGTAVNILGSATAPVIAGNIITSTSLSTLGYFNISLAVISLMLAFWFTSLFKKLEIAPSFDVG